MNKQNKPRKLKKVSQKILEILNKNGGALKKKI
jgi:hypothetical protein